MTACEKHGKASFSCFNLFILKTFMARLMKQTAEVRLCNCAMDHWQNVIYCILMPLTNSKYNIKHIKQLECVSHEIISGTSREQLGLGHNWFSCSSWRCWIFLNQCSESVQSCLSTHSRGNLIGRFLAQCTQHSVLHLYISDVRNDQQQKEQRHSWACRFSRMSAQTAFSK